MFRCCLWNEHFYSTAYLLYEFRGKDDDDDKFPCLWTGKREIRHKFSEQNVAATTEAVSKKAKINREKNVYNTESCHEIGE